MVLTNLEVMEFTQIMNLFFMMTGFVLGVLTALLSVTLGILICKLIIIVRKSKSKVQKR